MKENSFLRKLNFWKNTTIKPVALDHLTPEFQGVIERLTAVMPLREIQKLFTSTPMETGGSPVFPYCRVDAELVNCTNWLNLLLHYHYSKREFQQKYREASACAFKAVVWVEIGFDGLNNLAESDASKNWTAHGGHRATSEQRAVAVKTSGRELYENTLRRFVHFRDANRIKKDIFNRHGLEKLLEQWRY